MLTSLDFTFAYSQHCCMHLLVQVKHLLLLIKLFLVIIWCHIMCQQYVSLYAIIINMRCLYMPLYNIFSEGTKVLPSGQTVVKL